MQGPYHSDAAQPLSPPYVLPMRPDEPGEAIVFTGTVQDLDGNPLPAVKVDIWHAANDGTYSGFSGDPDCPLDNLRGIVQTGDDGTFQFRSIRPAPYQIPHNGGQLASSWPCWDAIPGGRRTSTSRSTPLATTHIWALRPSG